VRSRCSRSTPSELLADGGDLEPALASDLRVTARPPECRQSGGRGSRSASPASTTAFHARIIRSGGNGVVDELLTTMGPRLARLTYQVAIEHPRSSLDTLLAEHAET
jgi:hypothetical protein